MTDKQGSGDWIKKCTGCGYCCQQTPCLYGLVLNGPETPCPYLVHHEGRYWCGVLLITKDPLREKLAKGLRLGEGCIKPFLEELGVLAEEEKRGDQV